VAFVVAIALLYLVGAPLAMTVITAFRGPADYLPFEEGSRFTLDNVQAVYASDYSAPRSSTPRGS